jgi:hypothetical protein|tara:strand:+ start:449 stop:649 length:201 start_codon:yes stop_codon:yes gene_type:complete
MTAFMLFCTLNGFVDEGAIYFRNVNDCLRFEKKLSNQTYMKNNKEQVYDCICKVIPSIDPKKVKVY